MKRLLILDPGHGIDTSGKRGPVWSDGKQAVEWKLNRDIVYRIKEKIESDDTLSSMLDVKVTNRGDRDMSLSKRCNIANGYVSEYGKENSLFVSVHFNAAGTESANGWECWVSPHASKRAIQVANIFYDKAEEMLSGLKVRRYNGCKQPYWTANFTVLARTICPAVLTENGFMTNYDNTLYILSDKGQDEISDMHVEVVKEYISGL